MIKFGLVLCIYLVRTPLPNGDIYVKPQVLPGQFVKQIDNELWQVDFTKTLQKMNLLNHRNLGIIQLPSNNCLKGEQSDGKRAKHNNPPDSGAGTVRSVHIRGVL